MGDARMADVASAAGVAISTVSRALSNPDRVNERTRERILEAARDLAYIPNAMARNLRRGATQTAMVVVPGRPTSPVFTDLVAGIDEVMSEAGYRLIVGRMERERETGRYILDPSLSGTVDGAFVAYSTVPHFVERSLADSGIPLVGLMFDLSGASIPSVLIDDRHWAREAAGHLIALGHREIVYLAGSADVHHDGLRHDGILEAMAEAGLPPENLRRIAGDTTFDSGVAAARHCLSLERMPTAAIGYSDEMAIGFMKEVRRAGLSVPGDMSVVGFDGIAFSNFCDPTLSVVKQPLHEIGIDAADLMLRLLRGELTPPLRTLHTCRLLPRGSSGPPPQRRRRRRSGSA